MLLRWTYNQSRGGQVAKDLYSGFTGVLQCDGYSGYNNLKGVKRVGYWAHVRRKFYEASHISNTLKACEPLKLLDYMFFLENKWHKLAPKARRRLRHSNMKSCVMGRKNFLFSGVPEGAKINAILMTMIETAKANALDPMTYIGSLLDELAQFPEWRKSSDLGDYLP